WRAAYSGDANNAPGSDACGAQGETVTVQQAAPTLTSSAAGGTVGGSVSDTATVTGGYRAGGSVSFELFGPGDVTRAGTPLASSTVPVDGDGNYSSASVPVSHIGDYRWVATYSGDDGNAGSSGTCGDSTEISTVGQQ